MIERERKYRLDNETLRRLQRALARSAVLERREIQETVHFAAEEDRVPGLNLRLRTIGTRVELTAKGPRLESGPSKVREEHTVVLTGDPLPILAALGLVPTDRYRKRTEIYALDGAIVSLDDVDGLGQFCEVEGPDEATVERVAGRLGLTPGALETRGYARLQRSRSKVSMGEVE